MVAPRAASGRRLRILRENANSRRWRGRLVTPRHHRRVSPSCVYPAPCGCQGSARHSILPQLPTVSNVVVGFHRLCLLETRPSFSTSRGAASPCRIVRVSRHATVMALPHTVHFPHLTAAYLADGDIQWVERQLSLLHTAGSRKFDVAALEMTLDKLRALTANSMWDMMTRVGKLPQLLRALRDYMLLAKGQLFLEVCVRSSAQTRCSILRELLNSSTTKQTLSSSSQWRPPRRRTRLRRTLAQQACLDAMIR